MCTPAPPALQQALDIPGFAVGRQPYVLGRLVGCFSGSGRSASGTGAEVSNVLLHLADRQPQFIAKDFKEFIRVSGMTHVRTSPYYPQSNGKIERWHKSLKGECIRPGTPLSLEDARRLVEG